MIPIIKALKQHVIFLPPVLLLGVFALLLGVIFQIHTQQSIAETQASGLSKIKIIQVVDGKEQELNITDTTFDILSEAISSNNRFDDFTKNRIQNIEIKDIIFPPIPQEKINIVDKYDKVSIEKYLQDVYTIFMDNKVEFNINQLIEASLEEDLDPVQRQIEINTNAYNELFNIEVPQEILPLHRKYIQITQIHHHFLSNLLDGKKDPLKIQIDLQLALSLLDKLRDPITTDLKRLSDTFDLNYTIDLN